MKACISAAWLLVATAGLVGSNAHASVVLGGTRVVLDASRGEATLPVRNVGQRPALVESWIDDGDPNATPDNVHTPFLITPPLFRLDPDKQQSLRIIFTQPAQPLPNDRESLFWLNVQEIPPKPSGAAADKNNMQFAVRSRLKLFYRPDDLPGSSAKAPGQLTFKAVHHNGHIALAVHNPTSYYVTIIRVVLPAAGTPDTKATGMVEPFGDITLPLQHVTKLPATGTKFSFRTINDYGTGQVTKAVVQPSKP